MINSVENTANGTVKKTKYNKGWLLKTIFLTAMLLFPLTQFAIFYVYMNFNNIMMAFKGMLPDGSTYFNGINNFIEVFNGVDSHLIQISFVNNFKSFFLTLIIGMPLNILFGYYLYKRKFGSMAVRIIYMLPSMVSGVVMTMLFMKFVELGLPVLVSAFTGMDSSEFPNLIRNSNTAFGVQVFYILWLGFSTSLIIYSNAMFSIDEGIIEAGKIDGMTNIQELIYIIVPLIFPTLSTYLITGVSAILTTSGSLFLFYGLNDVPEETYFMGFYLFRIGKAGDLTAYPIASAVSVLITVITVPLTLMVRWGLDKIDPMNDVRADIM